MRFLSVSLLSLFTVLFIAACGSPQGGRSAGEGLVSIPDPQAGILRAVMTTSQGDIVLQLYAEKTPVTVASFLNLALRGYYDGLTFHRVVPKFVVQGGDPTGTGRGGPGYQFENEIVRTLSHDRAGILSMANSGPDTNGSQFFITLAATEFLDGRHTVFGRVVSGKDVLERIRKGDTIESIRLLDSPAGLFESQRTRIQQWNAVLNTLGF
ncbi:peptidylprolyl isomerase [Coraliomargarita parva]|uniref:peptidylprolyl isomerase n=1 Tax=Coraliomargarita parva TaxID=3014050 RepID=UPI0022B321E3|nr:peptidylprolyl isomerase [Coraliomargarita parva]